MMPHEIEARLDEIETRTKEIDAELEQDGADLDALKEEARKLVDERDQLKNQLEELKTAEAKAEEERKAVADGAGEKKEEHREENKMSNLEVRGSAAYAEAYKKYIISGDDKECRSLLTEIVSGDVPVPTLVENIIKHAW